MVENDVIQIYRRNPSLRELSGIIEAAGPGTREHYSTVEELWACLNANPPRRAKRMRAPGVTES